MKPGSKLRKNSKKQRWNLVKVGFTDGQLSLIWYSKWDANTAVRVKMNQLYNSLTVASSRNMLSRRSPSLVYLR